VFVPVIVGLVEPLSMADDRVVLANRALPWQEIQRDHPGRCCLSPLADKENHGWREGPAATVPAKVSIC
jgi:hypothetical protein